MTKEDIKRMEELCRLIQVENDPMKFGDLVAQLNDLLEDTSPRRKSDDEATRDKG